MNKIWCALLCAALALTACGSDAATDADGGGISADSGGGSTDGDSSGSSSDGGDGSGSDGGSGPDNEDAAEITGNEDLDLEELAEVAPDVAETLDEIDDIVSIGDCQSELVGLAMSYVPDGWQCRVLDDPVGGLDGFTLFMAGNPGGIEITIGTPSPLGRPCEMLQACDDVQPIDLGSNFDMEFFELAGLPLIFGTHKTVDAEAAVVTASALSDADVAFVTMVLDGVVEL